MDQPNINRSRDNLSRSRDNLDRSVRDMDRWENITANFLKIFAKLSNSELSSRSRDFGRDTMGVRDGSEMVVSDVCVKGEKKRHHHHHHKSSHRGGGGAGDFREPTYVGNSRREHRQNNSHYWPAMIITINFEEEGEGGRGGDGTAHSCFTSTLGSHRLSCKSERRSCGSMAFRK